MGFFLLMAAGNDTHQGDLLHGMRALMEDPEQMQRCSMIPPGPRGGRGRCGCSLLRALPPHRHPRYRVARTADQARARRSCMWYVSSTATRPATRTPTASTSSASPEHQAFGAGGRHFCLGTALARLELRILLEETLPHYPRIQLADGAARPEYVESPFINQLKLLHLPGSRHNAAGRTGPLPPCCPQATTPRIQASLHGHSSQPSGCCCAPGGLRIASRSRRSTPTRP